MQRSYPKVALAGFLAVSTAFILINLLTDRSSFWAIWPIWAFGMITAALVGMMQLAPHRLLGFWLGGGGVLQIGLFLIDLNDINKWWFFWPLGVWVIGAMAIAGLTVNLLDSVPTSRPMVEVERDRELTHATHESRLPVEHTEATRLPGA